MSTPYIPTIIKAYESLFQDAHGYWLLCQMEFNFQFCRCLDVIQLDFAAAWLSGRNSRLNFSFECETPYFVHVFKNESIGKNNEIQWCPYSPNFKVVKAPSEQTVPQETLLNLFNVSGLDCLREDDLAVLFVLLCLYKVNIEIHREYLIEFYFTGNIQAFYGYINAFANYLKGHKETDVRLHIKMINRIFKYYDKSDVSQSDSFKSNLFLPINKNELKIKATSVEIYRKNLCKLLDSYYLESLKINTLTIDANMITGICNIIRTVKNSKNRGHLSELTTDLQSIYNCIKNIIRISRRGGEPKIDEAMVALYKLIYNID